MTKPVPPIVTPVILSGGSGTRLWPASRRLHPKQFQPLVSERSILQETALRICGDNFKPPLVTCNHEHRFMVAEHFREIGVPTAEIILEPMGRNTAPAVAAAAIILGRNDPDALMLVLPSDHVIGDVARFHGAIETAAKAALQGALVAFSITPDRPETGYGYIKSGAPFKDVDGCFEIASFVEKPNRETAAEFLKEGGYGWNSGIFVFTAARFMAELERLQPAIAAGCRRAVDQGVRDGDYFHLGEEAFKDVESISIDYAVMEKTDLAAVASVDMGWSDLGSWASLWEVSKKDENGNVLSGDVVALDSRNCAIISQGPLVAALGLEDLVVTALDDAILVAAKDRSEEVRDLAALLEKDGRRELLAHLTVYRPWGSFTMLKETARFKVKQLTLNPGQRISLQRHKHRAEHWTVVDGVARVTRDTETFDLHEDQSTYIPAGTKHRLENPGEEPLHVIEVQTGAYLEEDDIERFEDVYGRQ